MKHALTSNRSIGRSGMLLGALAVLAALVPARAWAHGEIAGGGEQNLRSIVEGPGGKYRIELMHSPALPTADEPVNFEVKIFRLLPKPDPLLGSELPVSQEPQVSVLDAESKRVLDPHLPLHSEGEAGIFGAEYRFPASGQLLLRFLVPTDSGESVTTEFPVTVKTNVAAFFRRWVNFAIIVLILGLTAMQLRKVKARGGERAQMVRPVAAGVLSLIAVLAIMNFFVINRVLALREPKVANGPAETVTANEDGSYTIPKPIQQQLGIEVVPAKRISLEESFAAFGTVEPRADLMAVVQAPLWGRIEFADKPLAVGDQVKKGQTLVYVILELSQIERAPMEAKQQDIRGALQKAKERRDAAKLDYERVEKLAAANPAFEQDLKWAKQLLDDANAAHEEIARQDQAFLGVIKFRDPRRTPVTSPINGTITSVDFIPGELNPNGEYRKLFTIVDASNLWVRGSVYLSEAGKLRVGQQVLVYPTASSGKPVPGTVRYLDDAVDPVNRTLTILVDVPNSDERFPLGGFVRLAFATARQRVLAVPEEAVVDEGTIQRVYVAREQENFAPLQVEVGTKHDGWWQVVAGLEEGTLVVAKGAALLGSLPPAESEPESHSISTSLNSPQGGSSTPAEP